MQSVSNPLISRTLKRHSRLTGCPTHAGLNRYECIANHSGRACHPVRRGTDRVRCEVLVVSLAQRIHHAQRIKAVRKKNITVRGPKAYRTSTPCSCWMCGNPRKWFGERTVQERRAMQGVE